MALTLSGRKTKLKLVDFIKFAATIGLEEKVVLRLIANMNKALPKWKTLIQTSFLTEELKQEYENTLKVGETLAEIDVLSLQIKSFKPINQTFFVIR